MGQKRKDKIIKWEAPETEILNFGDLDVGDWFICLPLHGDNYGHSGLLSAHHIFIKTTCKDPNTLTVTGPVENAMRLTGAHLYNMPSGMLVIRVK